MNTPTKEQREKIDTAIDKITDLCASGNMTPSRAVAKVASAMNLTPDYLPIIVRAYNTGAAAIHREESKSIQEKAASYPIAYLNEVMSILKGECSLGKKASVTEVKDDFWDYPAEVHFPDAWDYLKDKEEPVVETVKKAAAKPHQVIKAHEAVMNAVDITANEATRVKYAAEEAKDQAYDAVVRELRKAGGIKPDVAREYAKVAYGKEGLKIINKMIKENYMDKKAQYQKETYIPDDHPFAKAFDNFVSKYEEFKKAAAVEKKVLENCVGIVNQYVRPKDRYIGDMDSIDEMFKEAEVARKKKRELSRVKQAYIPRSASGIGGITGLEAINHPGWVGLDRFERELMYGLADPAHEAELRRIRVQSILVDLLNTDPYLKEKDPEEVLDAMNEILELNPDIHKSKAMLRVALRQFMESGGMDIPTLGVVSEFGKEERQRKSQEKTQRENAAAQFASQIESARQADEKLRSEEERSREDREARERLQIEEQRFKNRETREEREARREEAEAERRFRREERLEGQRFTTSEREAGEIVQRELADLQRQLQADEGLANRMSAEQIAELGRIVQLQEGGENRAAQRELAKLQRDLQASEGRENRMSAEGIAREGRLSQEGIAEKNRKSQENEGHLNRISQGDIARLGRESQEGIAREGRKSQEDIAKKGREIQDKIAIENRKSQARIATQQMTNQFNIALKQIETQKAEGALNRGSQKAISDAQLKQQKELAEAQGRLQGTLLDRQLAAQREEGHKSRQAQSILENRRLAQQINIENAKLQAQQAAAEEEFARQKILTQQQQEHERQLEAMKARGHAIEVAFQHDQDAFGIQDENDLRNLIVDSFNTTYTTNNAKKPDFASVNPADLTKKYPKLTKGKFQ